MLQNCRKNYTQGYYKIGQVYFFFYQREENERNSKHPKDSSGFTFKDHSENTNGWKIAKSSMIKQRKMYSFCQRDSTEFFLGTKQNLLWKEESDNLE